MHGQRCSGQLPELPGTPGMIEMGVCENDQAHILRPFLQFSNRLKKLHLGTGVTRIDHNNRIPVVKQEAGGIGKPDPSDLYQCHVT